MRRREVRLDSRRLLLAAVLAAGVHAGLFFAIPAVLRLQGTKAPEYGDTVIVQLDEPASPTPVVTELPPAPPPPPPVAQPQPVAEPKPVPEPKTVAEPKTQPAPRSVPKPAPKPQAASRPQAAVPVTPLVQETPAPVPTGPAFKEAGQRTGVSAPLSTQPALGASKTPQAVPGSEPTTPSVGTPRGTQQAGTQSAQRSGVGVAVAAPTAKPAGSTTSGAAAGSTAGTSVGKTLDLGPLDKALTAAGSSAGSSTARSGSTAGSGSRGYSVDWDNPEAGKDRKLLSSPDAVAPDWVKKQGLLLTVVVEVSVTPEGVVSRARAAKSSGYADVDAAVLDAVRRWRFSPASTTQTLSGRFSYTLEPR
jgi:TonB family protein